MQIRRIVHIILFFFLVLVSLTAQNEEFDVRRDLYKIVELKRNAETLDMNKVHIRVKGYVVQRCSADMYMLQDETGVIKLHILPHVMPDFSFNDKIEIEVAGDISYQLYRTPIIEAKKVSYPKADF